MGAAPLPHDREARSGATARTGVVRLPRPSSSRVAELKVDKGAPHGMCTTHKDQVNADLLAFIQRTEKRRAA
jgi:hypothetical protein